MQNNPWMNHGGQKKWKILFVKTESLITVKVLCIVNEIDKENITVY